MQSSQQITRIMILIARASRKPLIALMLLCGLALMAGGCAIEPVSEAEDAEPVVARYQGFEDNTNGWLTQAMSGPNGWCGDIQRHEAGDGPVVPSAGEGYAVISHADCNDYYAEAFPAGGGPYAPTLGYADDGPIYSESTPPGGYVAAVDVYLDPSWPDGTSFNYLVSIHLLDVAVDDAASNPFRYFFLPITKTGGTLEAAGHEILDAGWYTIQAQMRNENGDLAMDFALAQDDEILATQPAAPNLFTGEPSEPVAFDNVGTGYSWFDLAEGQSLAIDEQRYWALDAAAPAAAAPPPIVVDVTVIGLSFDVPATTPAGWTTFRLNNESEMTHFALIERLPEGYGMADHQADIAPVFQEGFDLMSEGQVDAAMAAFGSLPAWFQEVVFLGGPGLTAPGSTSQATVYLEPGTYMIECYVKTNGIFHSYNPNPEVYGMVQEFTVTEEMNNANAPTADSTITISSENGIEHTETLPAGEQTIAVTFVDQTVHENFVGHDLHLVHVEDGTDLDAFQTWMDWAQIGGMETPSPVTFLGGLNEMPAGETGYLTVNLSPGDYAWIAEVPNAQEKGMLQTFTVAAAE